MYCAGAGVIEKDDVEISWVDQGVSVLGLFQNS